MCLKVKCGTCNKEYDVKRISTKDNPEETTFICCPVCKKYIHGESCFGFGPVYPAHLYEGEKLFAELHEIKHNQLVLRVSGREDEKLELPPNLAESTYRNHFEICKYVYISLQTNII